MKGAFFLYLSYRKVVALAVLIGLALATAGGIYWYRQVIYTASLDTRPLKIGMVGDIDSLQPPQLDSPEERLVASALYEGLVYYDEKTDSIRPRLARSWKYSADDKTLTIDIKKAQFSNGQPVTAEKVKAAWEKSFSTTKDWANISLFLPIEGSKARLEGRTPDIAGVEVVDSNTLRIRLEKPNAIFLHMLTNPIFWVYDAAETSDPAPGTGPYVLQPSNQDHTIALVKNDNYHRGLAKVSALQVTVYKEPYQAFSDFKNGKLDYLNQVPLAEIKNVEKNPDYQDQFIDRYLWETYSLGFNMHREPFAGNYLLRRALNFAVDRKTIIDTVLGDAYRTSKGALPMGMPGYNKQLRGYAYDPEKAKDLLAEAGYPGGEGLKPLVLAFNRDDGHRAVAEAIAQQFNELGIDVQLQELEWDYYKKQLSSMALTLFRVGWHADYPDADNFLYGMYHSSQVGISNHTGYNNPQVDKILDAARTETKSQQERLKLLQRAEEIIVDDAPMLWLFQKKAAALVGTNVRNLEMDGMGLIDWFAVELLKPSDGGSGDSPGQEQV
ncbi:MAG TPA: ABC transporter substrate-binding protein [Syntrophomonadaceae bacterium]|nr:ABC transporter substrate-binding protein [Syntrophomonadaceae bacterium]